ncbi:molybdate/tungstate import ATP-binding protein WtpC [Geobacter sp. OR-1]|uniref:ABC transporter ATP-binding protein n=1 Tax=Geobacter sp. OR-1 TaxID=1266765 RepID=UPI0005440A58|nr:ABC transporter ATP-binding protein [Geobacter sp. OR-1]GAM11447.1 molybdate/tungstate import ATP-binding protein WtpC [Geobacter sp. OR-1]
MTGGEVFLEVSDLELHRGGARVLSIPSFSLREREVLSLIGPNGAGKSTLLLALARLLPATRGSFRCRGEEIVSDSAVFSYRRRLGMVFQEPLLFDGTVFGNVASGLKIRGMAQTEIRERVMTTLELFGMTQLAERSARKLSGGEAQRTSLARAFAIRPEVIFLDEPFVALDPPTRQTLMDDLERILRETGTAAVLATHDQLEALRLSSRMVVMNRGEMVQSGPPEEVISRPVNEFVASFVGMENVLTGTVISSGGGVVRLTLGERQVEIAGSADPGETALFCIRPENVTIDIVDPSGETSARNVFAAGIRRVIPNGMFHKIHLDCGFPLVAYLTGQSIANLNLAEGKGVYASFKATAVHLIRSARRDGGKY